MKKLFYILIGLVILNGLEGQEPQTEIKKSTEKVIVNGRLYYLHAVQQGQTAYSISKAYSINVQELVKENPGLIPEQLQAGQVIKIPVQTEPETTVLEKLGIDKDDLIYHKVIQGENAFQLSRKYNVPLEVIYRLNPGSEDGIKVNQIIKVPKKKVVKEVAENIRDYENYNYYEVKRKDTLYSLAKFYNVAVADIINANPELRWGLKSGMVLKIPRFSQYASDTLKIIKDTLTSLPLLEEFSALECDSVRNLRKIQTVNVALLLPFYADFTLELKRAKEDTSYTSDDPNVSASIRRTGNIKGEYYFELYEGILLALDSLRNAGFTINLQVFDTEKDTNKVKTILKSMEINKPDIMIGPVFPETFKIAAAFATKHNIFIVSPIYSRTKQLKDFPTAFQFIPSRETEFEAMAMIASTFRESNLILIHDTDTLNKTDGEEIKNIFSRHLLSDNDTIPLLIKEIMVSDTMVRNIRHALAPGKKNLILITTNNEAYLSELMSHLDRFQKIYNITIIGQPSWLTFNNIDLEYFHNLDLHLYSPFYIDYKDIAIRRFIKNAINNLGYEPLELKSKGYNLTFLGYDIAFYFIKAYINYGKDLNRCSGCINENTLLNRYKFIQKNPLYGFENTAMVYLKFNKDFTVSRIFHNNVKNPVQHKH